MSLLIAMFPLYVMGNLHCLGMCGPIAGWIGASSHRGFYLLGRLVSFTIAGSLAGALGEVIGVVLHHYHLPGVLSIVLGIAMIGAGMMFGLGYSFSFFFNMGKGQTILQKKLQQFLLIDEPWPLFMLGFLTIALPCGQTVLVYSACALSGSVYSGTLNGLAFGLLTTPALFLAMHMRSLVLRAKVWYQLVVAVSAIMVGCIAVLRGIADLGIIPHFGWHPVMIY